MTPPSISLFIPAGSFQESLSPGTVIQVNLEAQCTAENQQSNASSLTFNSGELNGIGDIANNNGSLALEPGSGNPQNTANAFVPAGSYQNSSSDIQITLTATCNNELGQPINSSITYTPQQAAEYSDISNNNGNLEAITSSSISLSSLSDSDDSGDDDDDDDGGDGDGGDGDGGDGGAGDGGVGDGGDGGGRGARFRPTE